jgi:hypothetical protein
MWVPPNPVTGAYVAWTPLAGVRDYLLWVTDTTSGADNLFPDLVVNQPASVADHSAHWNLPGSLATGHMYKLWVKARNQNNQGAWSSSFTFTT